MHRSRNSVWRMLAEGALALVIAVTIAACDDRDKTSKQEADKKAAARVANMKADREMLKDAAQAGAELESRLHKAVSLQNGLMIVHNPAEPGMEMHVLPSSTPWMLNCGIFGVTVVFGSSVTGDSSSVQNDVEIVLTSAKVDPPICDTLAPSLARLLQPGQ
jgi:hypothetical protein